MTVHDLAFLRFPNVVTRESSRYYGQVNRACRSADRIIAVSNSTAKDLEDLLGIPRERIRVVHNIVVTPELRAKANASLEHSWFRPNEPPVALAVGSLSAVKDFALLIRAFAVVRQSRLRTRRRWRRSRRILPVAARR